MINENGNEFLIGHNIILIFVYNKIKCLHFEHITLFPKKTSQCFQTDFSLGGFCSCQWSYCISLLVLNAPYTVLNTIPSNTKYYQNI